MADYIRLYGIPGEIKANTLMILPGQGGLDLYRKDIYSNNLQLPDDLFDAGPFPLEKYKKGYYLLVEVDLKRYEVIQIIDIKPQSQLISNEELKEIEEYNKIILATDKTKLVQKIPIPDDIYINETIWNMIITAIKIDEYPLLIGPKGCGKSSIGRAVAKALNHKFFAINCSDLTRPESFLYGTTGAKDGSTYFNKSQFLEHYTSNENVIIYLQELSRITQNGANSLITITEQPNSFIYVKELSTTFRKGDNVKFMGDANFGIEYTGTSALDGAFFDRLTAFTIDYLPPNKEIDLLLKRVEGLEEVDATQLVEVSNKIRSIEDLNIGVSTRKLITMAKFLAEGFTMGEVINNIFINLFKNGVQGETDEVKNILNSII